MRKASIVFLCILLSVAVTACRQVPKALPPIDPPVDKDAEFLSAAYSGKTEEVSAYLSSGGNPNIKGTIGNQAATALYWAAEQGHVEIVVLLLSKKAEVNSLAEPDGSTPLIVAASQGHAAIVGLLLDHKADVNAITNSGATALKSAAENGHLEVVHTLVDKSIWIDFAARDQVENLTAQEWAAKNGHVEVAQLINVSTRPQLELDELAEAWLDSYKSFFIGTTFLMQNETLVLVSYGEVSTLGYGVEITRIVEGPTEVTVEVRLTNPEPGDSQLVHPNTPYVLTSIPTTKPIVFKTENPDLYIPNLAGVPDGFFIYEDDYWLEYVPDNTDSPARGNILLGTTPNSHGSEGTIIVEGLASVFEASVEYDFLDESGTPYGQREIKAAAAWPNWGYFRFEVSASLDNLTGIRIYSTSPRDSSIQDLVIIRP